MNNPLDKWKGQFGDDYAARNQITPELIEARTTMWVNVLSILPEVPKSIMEIGAGNGQNLIAIGNAITYIMQNTNNHSIKSIISACEPNDQARHNLEQTVPYVNSYSDTIYDINQDDSSYEFVFTSGVLIHIPPDKLDKAISEMYRVSSKYIFIAEYFAPQCEEIKYRDQEGMLWRNDFAGAFLEKFKLRVVNYGFLWKKITRLDNLTWTLMEKVH